MIGYTGKSNLDEIAGEGDSAGLNISIRKICLVLTSLIALKMHLTVSAIQVI
jgi:hypothetical protein